MPTHLQYDAFIQLSQLENVSLTLFTLSGMVVRPAAAEAASFTEGVVAGTPEGVVCLLTNPSTNKSKIPLLILLRIDTSIEGIATNYTVLDPTGDSACVSQEVSSDVVLDAIAYSPFFCLSSIQGLASVGFYVAPMCCDGLWSSPASRPRRLFVLHNRPVSK